MSTDDQISILYVDDEEINLFLFKASFQKKYHVITAGSGMEGLELLDQYKDRVIVVISDMNMPQMNGIQFIEAARQEHENLAYFILTGYDYSQEIDQALKSNIVHKFFTKPFVSKEIEAAVEDAFVKYQKGRGEQ
jgi:response regulator RpfG family c-di-GMP phosphodiesterase